MLLVLNLAVVILIPIFIASLFHLNPFSSWSLMVKVGYILISLLVIWEVFGSTVILLGADSLFMRRLGKFKIPLHFPPLHWTNIPKRIRLGVWKEKADTPEHKLLIADDYEWGVPYHIYRVITISIVLMILAYLISTLN